MKRPARVSFRAVGNAFGLAVIVASTTAVLWIFGLQWQRALALAIPITVVIVLIRTFTADGLNSFAWPEEPGPGDACAGWHHVALLSSSIHEATGDPERFRSIVAPRLRKLAENRLREHHLHWDDPLARDRLGPEVYDLLAWPPDRAPDMTRIRDAITRIEALREPTAGTDAAQSSAASGVEQ